MKSYKKLLTSVILSIFILCVLPTVAGCSNTEKETASVSDLTSTSASNSTSNSTSSSVSKKPPQTSARTSSKTSSVSSMKVSEVSSQQDIESTENVLSGETPNISEPVSEPVHITQSEPHFSFPEKEPLPHPTGETVSISSLSEALNRFSEISQSVPNGAPEDIVKTLMERNVLCFAAMQGKCWTALGDSGVVPIQSDYLQNAEQVSDLFYSTYTENQAWRLCHPQEAGGYGDVFRDGEDDDEGKLLFDLSHLRKYHAESFSDTSYIAVIEANDNEITFTRYNDAAASSSPNNMTFKAVKEYGEWRLNMYITDAESFAPQYGSLITTNRVGAPELMELAKQEVGNIGGEKYWGYYGFTEHIEWCAAFVSWIYGQAGKSEPLFFGCESGGAQWFKERDQWGDSDYEDIAPGDSIFFDWDLNGTADHVGLVVGTDGDNVYTIEGNRDDVCIAKSYSRSGYQWILGYGLMEW